MSESNGLMDNIRNFRPTMGQWLGSCAACAAATAVLGFTLGGWVTGGTAQSMAEAANRDGRADLVASICVSNFMASPDAAAGLATLRDTNRWQRDRFITDGGWISLAALEGQTFPGAARLCADRLADMEIPTDVEPTVQGPDDVVEG